MSRTDDPGVPAPPAADDEPLAEGVVVRRNRMRLSLVWLVPIVAALVGIVLVVRSFVQAGPEITIEFRSAEGLAAGRTEVRFKEVVVGRVTRVSLRPDRQKVIATVRLEKSVASLAAEDTRFWVVRPRIGSGGVSGLNTLLSGAYIGLDAGASDESAHEFVGLDAPPLLLRGEPGRSFVLRADDLGSLDIGSLVYHRRVPVGRVVGYEIDSGGRAMSVQIFVEAPYDRMVKRRTRFWNASGVELALNATGLTVNTQSIASVLAGGIAFGSADPQAAAADPPAPAGDSFRLFATERAALAPEDGEPLRVRMVFDQGLRGLEAGAPIDLLGIEIGTVRSVALADKAVGQRLPMAVTADLYPMRMGRLREQIKPPRDGKTSRDALLLARLVADGLRAQVRNGNLLTGALYIALDFVPKAAPAALDVNASPLTLPTVGGSFNDMQTQVAEMVDRLSKVRFDEIGGSLQEALKSATATSQAVQTTLAGADQTLRQLTPDAQRTLAELQRTLAGLQEALVAAQRTLGGVDRTLVDGDAPLPRQAAQTMAELQRAAQAARVLADTLQRHPESLLRGKPADAPEPAR